MLEKILLQWLSIGILDQGFIRLLDNSKIMYSVSYAVTVIGFILYSENSLVKSHVKPGWM